MAMIIGLSEVLAATFAATSTMTLFSYVVSENFHKLCKEPVLLKWLLTTYHIDLSDAQKGMAGWCIHYLLGLVFATGYYLPLWMDCGWYDVTWFSGFIFGCIIGVIGIFGWEMMFRFSPQNPPVATKGYYLQLFLAHIIFGITTVAVHLLLNMGGS